MRKTWFLTNLAGIVKAIESIPGPGLWRILLSLFPMAYGEFFLSHRPPQLRLAVENIFLSSPQISQRLEMSVPGILKDSSHCQPQTAKHFLFFNYYSCFTILCMSLRSTT